MENLASIALKPFLEPPKSRVGEAFGLGEWMENEIKGELYKPLRFPKLYKSGKKKTQLP